MSETESRWKKRFTNFQSALVTLDEAVSLANTRQLSKLEQQGLIQAFEYTHELAWKVMKDFLDEQGIIGVIGSRGATREAFKQGLVKDGQVWMLMIEDRNLTSHTYNQITAETIVEAILKDYHTAFTGLKLTFETLLEKGEQ
jgi:nucleotidyltransferase substrate binding protein (TIGR01987 family)